MRVSVVINTYRRAASLGATLEALRRQRFDDFEVVVVTGPDDPDTDAVLADWPAARVARCPEAHLSRSRNIGLDAAVGEIVAFLDDDAIPEPGWLQELLEPYADPEVGGVGGVVLDPSGVVPQYRFSASDRLGRTDYDRTPPFDALVRPGADPFLYLQGTNMSFRRAAVASVGGFDEQLVYDYDEVDLCLRLIDAGHRLVALDGARVVHRFAASHQRRGRRAFTDPFHQMRSRAWFAVRHGSATHGPGTVLEVVQRWHQVLRDRASDAASAGELDEAEVERYLVRLDEGLQSGLEDGFADRSGTRAIADPEASFAPYARLSPEGGPLRVALVSMDYPPGPPGGIARYTEDLAIGLAAAGHEVHVLTRAPEGPDRVDYEDGVWVHRRPDLPRWLPELGDRPGVWHLANAAAVRHAARRVRERFGLDVVSAPLWAAEGLLCAADPELPTVLTCMTPMRFVAEHQPAIAELPDTAAQIALEDASLLAADRLHAISQANLDALLAAVPEAERVPADLVPHGLRDAPATPPRGDGTPCSILFVGRLEHRKGVDVLGAALRHVAAPVRLRLVGADGGERATLEALEDDRIELLGQLDDAALAAAYAEADVVCLPSRYDSFGLVLLESMRAQRAVVAASAGGMPEIVEDGVTGLLVPPGDAAALGAALQRLASDDGLRRSLGAAGRERFETRYTVERIAAQMVDVLRQATRPVDRARRPVVEATTALITTCFSVSPDVAGRAADRLLDPAHHPVDVLAAARRAIVEATDEAFLTAAYRDLLGRELDDEVFELERRLLDGARRADVLADILSSDEARHRGLPAPSEIRHLLAPDEAERAVRRAWFARDEDFPRALASALAGPAAADRALAEIGSTASRPELLKALVDDPDVQARVPEAQRLLAATFRTPSELDRELRRLSFRPADEFTDGVYELLLERGADDAARRPAMLKALDGHRTDVVTSIAASQEAVRRGIDPSWLHGLTRRVPQLIAADRAQRLRRVIHR